MIGSFTFVIAFSMSGFASDGTGMDFSGVLLPLSSGCIKGCADDETGTNLGVLVNRIPTR